MNKQFQPVSESKKPPLGLVPRYIHNLNRVRSIMEATYRYLEAGKKVPKEWLAELSEIIETE